MGFSEHKFHIVKFHSPYVSIFPVRWQLVFTTVLFIIQRFPLSHSLSTSPPIFIHVWCLFAGHVFESCIFFSGIHDTLFLLLFFIPPVDGGESRKGLTKYTWMLMLERKKCSITMKMNCIQYNQILTGILRMEIYQIPSYYWTRKYFRRKNIQFQYCSECSFLPLCLHRISAHRLNYLSWVSSYFNIKSNVFHYSHIRQLIKSCR